MGVDLIKTNGDVRTHPVRDARQMASDSWHNLLNLARRYGFSPRDLAVADVCERPEQGWHSNDGGFVDSDQGAELAGALRRAMTDRPTLGYATAADLDWSLPDTPTGWPPKSQAVFGDVSIHADALEQQALHGLIEFLETGCFFIL